MEALREYTASRYSAGSDACKCGNCQLVPHAVVAHYADALDRITAERDEAIARAERMRHEREYHFNVAEQLAANVRSLKDTLRHFYNDVMNECVDKAIINKVKAALATSPDLAKDGT